MLTKNEKVLLLDEVASAARSSWQIYLVALEEFSEYTGALQRDPAYLGFCNIRNLLTASLMTACYALIDKRKDAYSLHHAVSDPNLTVSHEVRQHCKTCFGLRDKIGRYRNNVVAHVNDKRSQSDWAQAAEIQNGDIDNFLSEARLAIEGLSQDNMETGFRPCVTMPVRDHFIAFCQKIANQQKRL